MRPTVLKINLVLAVAVFVFLGFSPSFLGGQPLEPLQPPGPDRPLNREYGHSSGLEDLVSFGQARVVGPDEVVGDALTIGGDLTILGTVNGDAVCVGGNLSVGPTAVIRGDLVNVGGTLTVDPSATTYGDRVNVAGFPFGFLKGLKSLGGGEYTDDGWLDVHKDLGTDGFASKLLRLVMDFVYLLLLLCFALLLTTFFPRQLDNVEAHLTHQFPQSILLGIVSMVGVPITLLAFVISLIGILFIPFFLLALFISYLMGYIVFSRMVGRRVLPGGPTMLQVLGGLLALHAVFLIGDVLLLPGGAVLSVIGHVFRGIGKVLVFCVTNIGLGAVLYSLWGKREYAASVSVTPVTPEAPVTPENESVTESAPTPGQAADTEEKKKEDIEHPGSEDPDVKL